MMVRDRAPRRVTPRAPGWTAAWTIAPSSPRWLAYRPPVRLGASRIPCQVFALRGHAVFGTEYPWHKIP
jgi:hypothetical protein